MIGFTDTSAKYTHFLLSSLRRSSQPHTNNPQLIINDVI